MAKQHDKFVRLSLKSTLNRETTWQTCHIVFKVDFKWRDNVTNLSHCL